MKALLAIGMLHCQGPPVAGPEGDSEITWLSNKGVLIIVSANMSTEWHFLRVFVLIKFYSILF